jgi:hypothetical protein
VTASRRGFDCQRGTLGSVLTALEARGCPGSEGIVNFLRRGRLSREQRSSSFLRLLRRILCVSE